MLHETIRADLRTAVPHLSDRQIATIEALITKTRTATVEFNKSQKTMPWELRCYGQGAGVVARGMPSHFSSEEDAQQASSNWISSGTPVDRQVSL